VEEKACGEKICVDPKCREQWGKLSQACRQEAASFVYCPFCAEELSVHCSACQETIGDSSFRFCPWCGRGFEK